MGITKELVFKAKEWGTYVPVHEVKVKVLETEVLQGVLDGQLDVLGVVVELEQLGSDPELFSGYTGSLDTLTDFGLISVGPGAAVGGSRVGGGERKYRVKVEGKEGSGQRRKRSEYKMTYSMCRYPDLMACSTALATSPGLCVSAIQGIWLGRRAY
jgi:hypothetical protein